ncbi:MAG: hypothetical protein V3V22_02755 [Methylococcales bacterium]
MKRENWSPCLNQSLSATSEDGDIVTLELLENNSLGEKPEAGQEAYSLIFRGPLQDFPQQGIMTLQHLAIGTVDVFMVPIGSDQHGMCYEAIFN